MNQDLTELLETEFEVNPERTEAFIGLFLSIKIFCPSARVFHCTDNMNIEVSPNEWQLHEKQVRTLINKVKKERDPHNTRWIIFLRYNGKDDGHSESFYI